MALRVKIIVTSGLVVNGKAVEFSGLVVYAFSANPYTAERLLKIIAQTLSVE
jgi:hypothetical protein